MEILFNVCKVSLLQLSLRLHSLLTERTIRRVNAGAGPSTRETVRKSYEFAVSHVGQDKDSGDIWMDYIQFLKAGEVISNYIKLFEWVA